MPPKLCSLKHRTKLLWHLAPHRRCTIDRQESKEYFRCQLETFPQYLRDHYVDEFGPGHKVLAKGRYSCQFYSTSLRSLLTLDTIPDQVKIPCWHLPHVCAYWYSHSYPTDLWISLFVHVSVVPCHRDCPSRNHDITASELAFYSSDGTLVDSSAHDYDYESDG